MIGLSDLAGLVIGSTTHKCCISANCPSSSFANGEAVAGGNL